MGKIKDDGVVWTGESYDEDQSSIEELKKRHNLAFYKKCALFNLTIHKDDIVCIKNHDARDSEDHQTCDVAKVKYLYQDLSNKKPQNRAIVNWYSRPSKLQDYGISESLLNILDEKHELVEDSRFGNDIEISLIFDVGKMFNSLGECRGTKKPKARFFCNFKVQELSKRKINLVPLREKSTERIGMVLKRVQETDVNNGLKSPLGKWKVEIKRLAENEISLNSIENISQFTPKRKCDDDDRTPKKKMSISKAHTPSLMPCENSAPCTPTTKGISVRRKSILKTPTVTKSNTTRRSIQFSNVVEERIIEKKGEQYLTLTEESEECADLTMARKRLHVSAVPKSLPCREKEYTEIYSFLEGNLQDETGGCIYVSGVPGTGKTATTTEVIRALKEQVTKKNLSKFDFVEINGMRITEPRKAYVEIHRQLTGNTTAWEQAYNWLDKRFSTPSPRRIMTILLVDELDILCNKRQDVVYNLLNWPNLNSARLIVITIANTMDLPERVFMGKISSRLGLTRLTFQPYSHKQLQEIVASRIGGTELFSSDAMQLVARKVAALSGDARRALDICRRAAEIAEHSTKNAKASVSMSHVQKALNEMISSTKVQTIKSCSKMEQLFLQAVCMEVERTGIEEVVFRGVYNQLKAISTLNGLRIPTTEMGLEISSQLSSSRLIISEHPRKDIYQKILLNISADDFYYATQLKQQE